MAKAFGDLRRPFFFYLHRIKNPSVCIFFYGTSCIKYFNFRCVAPFIVPIYYQQGLSIKLRKNRDISKSSHEILKTNSFRKSSALRIDAFDQVVIFFEDHFPF